MYTDFNCCRSSDTQLGNYSMSEKELYKSLKLLHSSTETLMQSAEYLARYLPSSGLLSNNLTIKIYMTILMWV
jgi:hypothetical protein